MADKPFAIIGVNSDKDLNKVRAASAEKSLTWRSFWNGEAGTRGPISKKWQISSWPSTFLLDKDGVIRYKNLRGEALDKAIEELMAEMGEEVKLVGVDHEAEDEAAMTKAKEAAAKAKAAEAEKEKEVEASKDPEPKTEEPKVAPKVEAPKAEEPKAEGPKGEAHDAEAPKLEVPKTEEPKLEAPKAETTKG